MESGGDVCDLATFVAIACHLRRAAELAEARYGAVSSWGWGRGLPGLCGPGSACGRGPLFPGPALCLPLRHFLRLLL
jgi:hypothetical protein